MDSFSSMYSMNALPDGRKRRTIDHSTFMSWEDLHNLLKELFPDAQDLALHNIIKLSNELHVLRRNLLEERRRALSFLADPSNTQRFGWLQFLRFVREDVCEKLQHLEYKYLEKEQELLDAEDDPNILTHEAHPHVFACVSRYRLVGDINVPNQEHVTYHNQLYIILPELDPLCM